MAAPVGTKYPDELDGFEAVSPLTRITYQYWNTILSALNAIESALSAVTLEVSLGSGQLPSYTTAQRDLLEAGAVRIIYNSTSDTIQVYQGGAWYDIVEVTP